MHAWNEWLSRWRSDLRVALRSLKRSPTFAIAAIAILSLSVGTATAMFTVFKVVLIDRLPVTGQDRLVIMNTLDRKGTHLDIPYAYLDVIARDSGVFHGAAGVYHKGVQLTRFTSGSSVIQLGAADVSPNFFDVLGMRPRLGRLLRPEDGHTGAVVAVVLSYEGWRRQFGGDSSVIGRALTLPYTEKPASIVGVAPPGFQYPAGTEAWFAWERDTANQQLQVDIVTRLKPSVSTAIAQGELLALAQRINPFVYTNPRDTIAVSPHVFDVFGVAVQPLESTLVGSSRPALEILTLAIGTLLLIACVNVGSLVLVRLIGRSREVAIRRVIGASYADLVRLFALENGIIAVIGAGLGLATAFALLRTIAVYAPSGLPRRDMIGLSGPPWASTAATSLCALIIFCLLPSLTASRIGSFGGLRADSRAGTTGTSKQHARRWLVAAQIALALVMLADAALLVRSLARLQSMDLGYSPEHLSVLTFTGPQSALPTPARIFETGRGLVARIEATPGVIAATPINSAPFEGQSLFIMQLTPADRPASERDRAPYFPWEYVSPGYFRTFAIPIHRGRGFTTADTKGSEKVIVVNETLAKQFWPGQDAIGKRVVKAGAKYEWTVVGVASDTHLREFKNVGPVAYFDWEQMDPFWTGYVAVRSNLSLATLLPSLRAAMHDANPALVLVDAQTMDRLIDTPMAQARMSTMLLGCFSVAALLLAVIGLYGVMSSVVRQQTRDIGVRVALGATPANVRRLVFVDAIRIVGAGALVGLLAAVASGRLIASQLFDVSPVDPIALATATILLIAIGLVATYAPARRAARIDPVEALRAE